MKKDFIGTKEEIINKCKKILTKEIVDYIEDVMSKPYSDSMLIAVLHKVQDRYRYLDEEKMQAVSYLMNIPASKVSWVVSFYHFFHTKSRGKYIISICLGTACHVKGANKIVEKFQEELGIKIGETTSDKMFTLEGERCIGTCALAPVVKINNKIYSQVSIDQIPKILEEYFNKK